MKYKSQIIAAGSGSVAGCVFSRNRYGPYVRNRSLPINPNSAAQQNIRSIFSQLATAWNVDLDAGERAAWDAYAAVVPRINSLGDPIFTTGLNWYIAMNTPRVQLTEPRIDAAPILLNMTGFGPAAVTIADTSAQTLTISFDPADEWNADDGFVMIGASRGLNESINFFKGPFRFAGFLAGNTAVPLTSPQVIPSVPFPFGLGQRLFARMMAMAPDGRISTPQIVSRISVA